MQTRQGAFLQEVDYRILCLSWRKLYHENAKNSVVSRSSAESEYRAMTNVTLEQIWIRDLFFS